MKKKLILLMLSSIVALSLISLGYFIQNNHLTRLGFVLTGFPFGGLIGIIFFKNKLKYNISNKGILVFYIIIFFISTAAIFIFRMSYGKWQNILITALLIASAFATIMLIREEKLF